MNSQKSRRAGQAYRREEKYDAARDWYNERIMMGLPITEEMRRHMEELTAAEEAEAEEISERTDTSDPQETGEAQYRQALQLSKSQDPAARTLFEQAARLGHPKAQFSLARLFDREGDRENALFWFRMAAEQGHEMAQSTLFRIDPDLRKYVINDILPSDPDLL